MQQLTLSANSKIPNFHLNNYKSTSSCHLKHLNDAYFTNLYADYVILITLMALKV